MALDLQMKIISSLEKVFWDEELSVKEYESFSVLKGERLSFQAAVRFTSQDKERFLKPLNERLRIKAELETDFECETSVKEVAVVAVNHPIMEEYDGDYLKLSPGLYPDILYEHRGAWSVARNQWRCLWVTVDVPPEAAEGVQSMRVRLFDNSDGELLLEKELKIEIIPAVLPEQSLIYTQWFHLDCLASYYKAEVFSERHWQLIGNYIKHAAENGINLLLTPIFTPPLDTEIGHERPTVQLVDIFIRGSGYGFGFSRLDRYMQLAEDCGIKRFEISHLYTQWGAKYAPKIVAYKENELIRLFGWDTDASCEEYGNFLRCFLRSLKEHLSASGRLENCWFHISDEPDMKAFDSYKSAYDAVSGELEGCKTIDALSDYDFYKKGYSGCPIASLDRLDEFIENGAENLWTYYCNGQLNGVSNRLIAMPSYRNRILGFQLYKYGIKGFLQWGYNYWYSFLSKELINPFFETGALDTLPAGDAFSVYPGMDGCPIPSIREAVFFETLQDMRALDLLERLVGREEALRVLDPEDSLTISNYPRTAEWLIAKREEINQSILEAVKSGACDGDTEWTAESLDRSVLNVINA